MKQGSTSHGLRIVFAGTPDFAAIHLRALLQQDYHRVIAVYTQPDRPAGRGKKLAASPVKQLATAHSIPVYQPQTLKTDEARQQLAALDADLMLVVAYGLLLPPEVLSIPRLGCINVHASLLPRWRGAAPIQRAIEAGDSETGITIMQMDAGLDTGDMLFKVACPIMAWDTGASLHDRLAGLGPHAMLKVLNSLATGTATPEPQNNALSTYAPKITKQEAQLDWRLPARDLELKVRTFNPFPVAYTDIGGERIRVWSATVIPIERSSHAKVSPGVVLKSGAEGIAVACGEGALLLTEIQLPGKKRLPVAEVLKSRSGLFAAGGQCSRVD